MFALWIEGALVVSVLFSVVLFSVAKRGESTLTSETAAFFGLAAISFGVVLAIMGAIWVIELVAAALGF